MLETPVSIRRAAMNLLARREHGHVELTRKLRQRGADPEMIEIELQRLIDDGLLSEQRFLESYIRSRANSGRGPRRISEELAQRGVERNMIEQALNAAEIDWNENMCDLWQRRFAGEIVDLKDKARQTRFLIQRGYAADDIRRLLDEQGRF
ncbi:MAG TPA: regulatory protein RecX [Thiopseudomonas sp.]|nr:regulatory protein RecX [Thiopseudomonas sp.]